MEQVELVKWLRAMASGDFADAQAGVRWRDVLTQAADALGDAVQYEGLAVRLYRALDGVLPTEIPGGPGHTEVPNSRLREGNAALEEWDRVEIGGPQA